MLVFRSITSGPDAVCHNSAQFLHVCRQLADICSCMEKRSQQHPSCCNLQAACCTQQGCCLHRLHFN